MPRSAVPYVYHPSSVPYYTQPQSKIKRQNLTFQQRLQVVEFYHAHENELNLGQMIKPLRDLGFSTICATTIRRCVNREAEDRAFVESGNASRLNAKRNSPVCLPEVEAELLEWVKLKQDEGLPMPSDFICGKARMICEKRGIPEESRLKFSKSWLEGFKKRHGLNLSKGIPWYGVDYTPRWTGTVLPVNSQTEALGLSGQA